MPKKPDDLRFEDNKFIRERVFTKDAAISKLENVGNFNVLVPKWKVGLAIIGSGFIITVLVAAVVILDVAPPPALISQSCVGRSCLQDSNLKCINETCQCQSDFYYSTKCTRKREYSETCSRTTPCKNSAWLTCKNGRCDCNDTNYWNGSYCAIRNLYKEQCESNTNCLVSVSLYCNTKTKQCLCDNKTRYTHFNLYDETCVLANVFSFYLHFILFKDIGMEVVAQKSEVSMRRVRTLANASMELVCSVLKEIVCN